MNQSHELRPETRSKKFSAKCTFNKIRAFWNPSMFLGSTLMISIGSFGWLSDYLADAHHLASCIVHIVHHPVVPLSLWAKKRAASLGNHLWAIRSLDEIEATRVESLESSHSSRVDGFPHRRTFSFFDLLLHHRPRSTQYRHTSTFKLLTQKLCKNVGTKEAPHKLVK